MFRPPSLLTGSGRPPDIPEETDNLEVNNFKISPVFFDWGGGGIYGVESCMGDRKEDVQKIAVTLPWIFKCNVMC